MILYLSILHFRCSWYNIHTRSVAIEYANAIDKLRSKSIETEFWNAICRKSVDKLQSKTLFLAIVDPLSSIVKSFFDCPLSGVIL